MRHLQSSLPRFILWPSEKNGISQWIRYSCSSISFVLALNFLFVVSIKANTSSKMEAFDYTNELLNKTTCLAEAPVIDKQPGLQSIITSVPSYPDINCGDPLPALDKDAITTDPICDLISVIVGRSPDNDFYCEDTEITYTWIVTDECGNDDSASTSFTVFAPVDLPQFAQSPNPISDINCHAWFPSFQYLGIQHCTEGFMKTERIVEPDICAGYPITYRWTPVSACGVEGEPVELSFDVLPDGQGPIMEDPSDIVDINCGEALPAFEDIKAYDLCIADNEAPIIYGNCLDFFGCSRNGTDGEAPVVLTASDNCTLKSNLRYAFSLDLDDDGADVFLGNGTGSIFNLNQTYPIGTHRVIVSFFDVAGNENSCNFTFTISECTPPAVNCIPRGLNMSLIDTNDDGVKDTYGYMLNANALDIGSYDNMGKQLSLSFSQLESDSFRLFTCKDLGENDVFLYAKDSNGNHSLCYTEVLISDASNQCGLILGPSGSIPNEYACKEFVEVTTSIDPYVENPCLGYQVVYRYTASDGCDNNTQKTTTINVLPSMPRISAPQDVTINLEDSGDCDMEVNLEPATPALDLCSPIASFETIYPGGSMPGNGGVVTLDAGLSIIYYLATDECGNMASDSTQILLKRSCVLACRDKVNISVDSNCQTELRASMVGSDIPVFCDYYYEIEAVDQHGNVIEDGLITSDLVGQEITITVIDPFCGNSCWGKALIEDKFPPKLECQDVIITSCHNIDVESQPKVIDNCNNYYVKLTNESIIEQPCDRNYSMRILRTYIAEDIITGLKSNPCTQVILVERIDLEAIDFPENVEIACDGLYPRDDNGNPDPAVTGVPTLNGEDIFPVEPKDLCNTLVYYSDYVLHQSYCQEKIVRTWEASEWWCAKDFVEMDVQMIEIVDNEPPQFTCRYDTLSMSTSPHECFGYGILPPLSPVDNCSHDFEYLIEYPGGQIGTNGGAVEMPRGVNEVFYTVFDECANSATCRVMVKVEDFTPPIAICERFKVVSLPTNGWIEVKAEVFDLASRDECGVKEVRVRRMDTTCFTQDTLFGPTIEFCCEDVGNQVVVAMQVTDWAGNHNTCMVIVTVQDKVTPSLICPDDVTVFCNDPYNFNDLSDGFGFPSVSELCTNVNIEEEVTRAVDQCGIGRIVRDFSVERNGFTQSCTQVITVERIHDFDYNSIVWPESFTSDKVCDLTDLDPDNLSAPFNKPIYQNAICDLIGHHYEDEVFAVVPDNDACSKILRSWTIINWCDRLQDGTFRVMEYQQTIKTSNTEPPVIVGSCDSIFVCNQDFDCIPDSLLLVNSAMDDCTDSKDLQWTFSIDLFRDGSYDTIGYNDSIYTLFPYGEHLVKWEVLDNCNNWDRCEYLVEVRNCKAPSPVCINGLAVDLVPMDLVDADGNPGQDGVLDNEMAELWAIDFEASSVPVCGSPITFSFSPDINDINKIFDCDDIGINTITLYVTDLNSGAQDFCETFVDIQDNNSANVCDSIGNRANVFGRIFTEDNIEIENVEVDLFGSSNMHIMSDQAGNYKFPDMPFGGNYVVDPAKHDEPLNGVSTLDLVLMQKHILGIQMLPSPYKMIASDVNLDDKLSTLDLIELRKLILGIYSEFPQNDSWRFVNAEYVFADLTQPWNTPLEESYDINGLNANMKVDFIGMKTGDVNNSVELGFWDSEIDDRSNEEMVLYMEDSALTELDLDKIEFKLTEETSLEGFQMSLSFDPDQIHIVSVSSNALKLGMAHVNILDEGIIHFSWHNISGEASSLKEGESLFEIKLNNLSGQALEHVFSIQPEMLKPEKYMDQKRQKIVLENWFQNKEHESDDLKLFQNKPNPWSNETIISFYVPASGIVDLNIYDHSGRKLKNIHGYYSGGFHDIGLNRNEIQATGLILYELIYEDQLLTKRMLLLD